LCAEKLFGARLHRCGERTYIHKRSSYKGRSSNSLDGAGKAIWVGAWCERTARQFALQASLWPTGRPRKQADDERRCCSDGGKGSVAVAKRAASCVPFSFPLFFPLFFPVEPHRPDRRHEVDVANGFVVSAASRRTVSFMASRPEQAALPRHSYRLSPRTPGCSSPSPSPRRPWQMLESHQLRLPQPFAPEVTQAAMG